MYAVGRAPGRLEGRQSYVCLCSRKQFGLCTQLEGRQADLKGAGPISVYIVQIAFDYINKHRLDALQVCLAPFQLRT